MQQHYSYKTLWSIAYPIMLGNLAQTLIAMTDTAFLGRLSSIALGASMVAGVYYYVVVHWAFQYAVHHLHDNRHGLCQHILGLRLDIRALRFP